MRWKDSGLAARSVALAFTDGNFPREGKQKSKCRMIIPPDVVNLQMWKNTCTSKLKTSDTPHRKQTNWQGDDPGLFPVWVFFFHSYIVSLCL